MLLVTKEVYQPTEHVKHTIKHDKNKFSVIYQPLSTRENRQISGRAHVVEYSESDPLTEKDYV